MKEHPATYIAIRAYQMTGDANIAMEAFRRHGGLEVAFK